jgi:hypothetical protein
MPPDAKDSPVLIDLNTGRIASKNNDGLAPPNARLKWTNTCTNLNSLSHRRRANGKVFNTRITWKDATDGAIHKFTIKGQQTTCAVCPKDSNLVFVGTRTNAAVGKGTLSCLQAGRLLWQFHPIDTCEYAFGVNYPAPTMLTAYPYRVVSPDDGRFVAFSFMDHAYLLNNSGTLIGHWNRQTLVPDNSRPPDSHEGITTRVIVLGDGETELKIETELGPAMAPRVQAMACAADGGFLIVAIANHLLWIAPSGQIAHSISLTMGNPPLPGGSGTIGGVHLSRGGDT